MSADAFYAEVIDKYTQYINPNLAKLMSFAGFGVEMRGEGCTIIDHEGRKYLDCLGGYGTFAFGHRHPKIVEAVRDQLDHLALSGKAFFSAKSADLAEKLAEIAPEGLQYSFFCNSGAEAVDGSLKFAKGATGRSKIISTEGSFHGKTLGPLSVTGRDKYRAPYEPLLPGVAFVPYGDAEAAVNAIDDQTAAFIVEPIQGEGGVISAPDGYLKAVREATRKHGALMIVDEVQTGMGRTGRNFGSEWEGISGDLMPLAKAIGGGIMPLGVFMGTREVWDIVYGKNPLTHTSTFGGNPLACAAGCAAVDLLVSEGLAARADAYGELFRTGLRQVAARHTDLVKEVRGKGLLIGIEMTMDEVGELTVAQLLKRGVCVAYTLNNPRVLRIEPPLIVTDEQIQFACDMLDEAFTETAEILSMLV